MRAGVAYEAETYSVSADVDYVSPIRNEDTGQDRVAQVNARVGGLVRISPGVWLGAGLFSDRSAAGGPRSVDFYGGTFGLRLRSDRTLDKTKEEDDKLTFETVVAVRYAYGFGNADSIRTNLLADPNAGEEVISLVETDLGVHELTLTIGAGLRF